MTVKPKREASLCLCYKYQEEEMETASASPLFWQAVGGV